MSSLPRLNSGVLQRVSDLLFEGPLLEHEARHRVAAFVAQAFQVQPDVPQALLPGPGTPHGVVPLTPMAERGPAMLRPVKVPM